MQTANEEILVAVIIENGKALENVDEILSVEGIDACSIGHFDLFVNLGFHCLPLYLLRIILNFQKLLTESLRRLRKLGSQLALVEM